MMEDAEGFGPPEKVHVENEWRDGPRAGVADVGEAPHYFESLSDEPEGTFGTFAVWPADRISLAQGIEQWRTVADFRGMERAP
jgi:hypothetical protein